MKIAISGASGFVGTSLKEFFTNLEYEVVAISRNILNDEAALISLIESADVVINLAGANILARWTKSYKEQIYNSRIDTTKAIVNAISKASKKPRVFISTSAVGIYSARTENSEEKYKYADDFLANVCKTWEKEAFKASEFTRVVIFRFGIVLGKHGGAFAKMIKPFRFGLGGNIGEGTQYLSFIHISDLLNAYKFIIERDDLNGVFNLTEPYPTINQGLTMALAIALKKNAFFDIPEFVLKLIFGDGAKVLTSGQYAVPKRLQDSGFEFEFDTIDKTIDDLTE